MTRSNKYSIEIAFEKGNSFNSVQLQSSYIGSRNFKDDIEISPTLIKITAFRSSKINLEDIFYNHTSSMYIQILKTLIYFYLNSNKFVLINNISIQRYRDNKKFDSKEIKSSELTQVLTSEFKILQSKINKQKLTKLFDNDEKGEVILIASSYLAKASSIPDEIETFERLWKAFNRIYKFIGNNQNETNCHITLRTFILKNISKFNLSINKVKMLTSTEIRNKLRWRALILNDYESPSKTKAFHDFVLRYSDKRIMEVIKEILPYRKDNLISENLYNKVETHVNSNIQQNHIKDEELVALLCIKYMYFVETN